MKRNYLLKTALVAALVALTGPRVPAQAVVEGIELVRSTLRTDRKVVIAEGMSLTEQEGQKFWPLYREYRADMDKIGDGIVKLVLEYDDVYPDMPEGRAQQMLTEYTKLEQRRADLRALHLRKIRRVLPASKTLRFAQLENRLDLAVNLRLASAIPLVPVPKPK